MPRTIASGFDIFRSNLEITGLQKSTVSKRQKNVRIAVVKGFDVIESFLAGSYVRSTMISPLKQSDVDIFIVIDTKYYYDNTPSRLLDKLRAILKKTYPDTPKISRNGQAVTISFTDFKVDVVPCFHRKGGGYLIADSYTDKWIETDPTIHQTYLTQSNEWHNEDLIPLIKMIKAWNRCINNAFSGFYLELLVKKILTSVEISDYPSGLRYFFDKGRVAIKSKIIDPAKLGEQVNGLSGVSNVNDAVSKFETAYKRSFKAESYAKSGNMELAFEEWKKIFPNYFPSYR